MRRPRKLEIWIACPECHGEGRAFLTTPDQKHQQCYRCRGRRYVRCTDTKRVWYEFTCTTTALKNLNRRYWLQLTDSLLAHIEKLENNRFSLVNELDKEQKKNYLDKIVLNLSVEERDLIQSEAKVRKISHQDFILEAIKFTLKEKHRHEVSHKNSNSKRNK